MKKVTDLKESEVIHVQTEEEDLAIRTLMHEAGLRWSNGDSYLDRSGVPVDGGKYYRPTEGTKWTIEFAKKIGYKIYPASDFLESSLESLTEQLKKLAKSKGMKAEIVLSAIDIWEGVEFVMLLNDWNGFEKGSVARVVDKEEVGLIVFSPIGKSTSSYSPNAWFQKDLGIIKPSTESAYVDQLKVEAKKRFGEIKEEDKFKEPDGKDWAIRGEFMTCGNVEWHYEKKCDILLHYSLVIYQSGKWAERVEEEEKIKVKWTSSGVDSVSLDFEFEVDGDHGLQYGDEAGKYLAKKLQKYLNRKK